MKIIYFLDLCNERDEILFSEPENTFSQDDYVNILANFGRFGKYYELNVDKEYLSIKTFKNYLRIIILTDNTQTVYKDTVVVKTSIVYTFLIEKKDKKNGFENLSKGIIYKISNFANQQNLTINEQSMKALEQNLPKIVEKIFFRKNLSLIIISLVILIIIILIFLRGILR